MPLIGDVTFTQRVNGTIGVVDRDNNYSAILYRCPSNGVPPVLYLATAILDWSSLNAYRYREMAQSDQGLWISSSLSGGKDVFCSYLGIERAGLRSLNEGRAIEFELVSSRGKTSAENLRVR